MSNEKQNKEPIEGPQIPSSPQEAPIDPHAAQEVTEMAGEQGKQLKEAAKEPEYSEDLKSPDGTFQVSYKDYGMSRSAMIAALTKDYGPYNEEHTLTINGLPVDLVYDIYDQGTPGVTKLKGTLEDTPVELQIYSTRLKEHPFIQTPTNDAVLNLGGQTIPLNRENNEN